MFARGQRRKTGEPCMKVVADRSRNALHYIYI